MENKAHILNMYFVEHKKQREIAESLGVSQQYVSKIIKADSRYVKEKESRKIQHQQKRKETKAQYQKQHRQSKYDDIEYQRLLLLQRQHAIDISGKTRFFYSDIERTKTTICKAPTIAKGVFVNE